jgi:methyl-accepting chemotaxis protein
VASEVKNLANQTAAATKNISREIAEMQTVSASVAATVGEAVRSADLVSQYVATVASALEQQSAATREISSSAQSASHALVHINDNVKKIAAR